MVWGVVYGAWVCVWGVCVCVGGGGGGGGRGECSGDYTELLISAFSTQHIKLS